jgi:lysophospholipase L1-like esterase
MKLSRIAVRILPVALVGFLAFAIAPVFEARSQEGTRFARWEKEIRAFEEKDRASPPPRKAIVFVGSSTIRRWDLGKSFLGMDVINRGFGGSELADSVHFAPRIVLPYEPRTVVLYAGDNDIGAGKTPEQVAEDFQAFTRVIFDRLPKTRIVFISIKPSPLRWKVVDKGRKANDLIADLCKKDDRIVYVDVTKAMLDADGKPRRELFAGDGLHLTAKGYELWATVLKPYLR